MTTAEQNHTLTRTGPGTPMGTLFRRYWIPALMSSELPERDGPPVRVHLLSEKLIAFRDSDGKVALIDEFCAHRRVSLWFGRVEEAGIRCPYHGWKYDASGHCVELPSEPEDSPVRQQVKLKSYPCVERGGIVWAYMGPPEQQPPLPEYEWATVPDTHRYISKRIQDSNYLQGMEGGIDSSHVSWLHSGELKTDKLHVGTDGARHIANTRPSFELQKTAAGLAISAKRAVDAQQSYWRVTQWLMPWYTIIPPYGENAIRGHAWVPIDDEHCTTWNWAHHPTRPLTTDEVDAMSKEEGAFAQLIPGSFQSVANKANDYLINRAAQKTGRYFSGVKGIAMQDASLQESMGPVVERELEFLVSTDVAIVRTRRRLLDAAAALAAGEPPPGVEPAAQHVRSASFVGPTQLDYQAFENALKVQAGAGPTSI